jgi:hypothetical protein
MSSNRPCLVLVDGRRADTLVAGMQGVQTLSTHGRWSLLKADRVEPSGTSDTAKLQSTGP